MSTPEASGASLYIVNLHPRTKEEDLIEHFKPYGTVTQCSIVLEPRTGMWTFVFLTVSGLSRCFGFATMQDSEQADAVIQALEGSQLDGKSIHIEKVEAIPTSFLTVNSQGDLLLALPLLVLTWENEKGHQDVCEELLQY